MLDRKSAVKAITLAMTGAAITAPQHSAAQSVIAPLVAGQDEEFTIDPITAGPLRVSPRVISTARYDSNVLASPDGTEIDDLEFIVRPEIDVRFGDNNVRVDVNAYGQFSRYLDFTTEDSDTYGVTSEFSYSPTQGSRLSAQAGYFRFAEDRSDPEARNLIGPGPRLVDNTFGNLSYVRSGGRILLDLEAEVREIDAVSVFDDDRDFTSTSGRATLGYRVSGPIYATVTGFVVNRDFKLAATAIDPSRDATTYGARAGVTFFESPRFRGRAGIGLFKFDPKDARIDARTGLSVDASVSYLPTPRSAFILDAFRGDVATFQRGAQARTDTRAALTGQFEMRHNFYLRAGVRWRKTDFIGSGIEEETYGPTAAVEFLANRRLSLIAETSVSERISDDLSEEFERFRVGITARFRF